MAKRMSKELRDISVALQKYSDKHNSNFQVVCIFVLLKEKILI